MKKIFDDSTLIKIRRLKIKKEREFESIFLMRIFGGTIVEVVCYGAGVLGVGFGNYLLASVLSHLPFGILLFFAADNILNGKGALLSLILLGFAVILFYKLNHLSLKFRHTNYICFHLNIVKLSVLCHSYNTLFYQL